MTSSAVYSVENKEKLPRPLLTLFCRDSEILLGSCQSCEFHILSYNNSETIVDKQDILGVSSTCKYL